VKPARLAVAIGALFLASCGLASHHVAEEAGTKTVAVTGTPAVVVETFNGSVEVTAASGPGSVVVAWTKRGSSPDSVEAARADLAHVEVTVASEGGTVRVVARRTDGRAAHASGARFAVAVPRGCPLTLTSSNGRLLARGLDAPVSARTSNGRVTVEGGRGALSLATSNGAVEAGGEAVVLSAESSNGSVRFSGSLADGAHSATTSNGSIEVALPAGARFTLDAKTSNGKVVCDFPLSPGGEAGRTSLRGTVGADPRSRLTLETSNGSIEVRRAP
jgi:DUF4097 and DUF4098 domain-containing protein YvlB